MDKDSIIEMLNDGEDGDFNQYRAENPKWCPNLVRTDLSKCDLAGDRSEQRLNLRSAKLFGSTLPRGKRLLWRDCYPDMTDAVFDITTRGPRSILAEKCKARFVSPSVFISYSRKDRKVVERIDRILTKKFRLRTIRDATDFFAGQGSIESQILSNMESCNVILCFHSKNTRNSHWIELEREHAKILAAGAGGQDAPPKVLFVILDNSPLSQLEAELSLDSQQEDLAIVARELPWFCRLRRLARTIYYHILEVRS